MKSNYKLYAAAALISAFAACKDQKSFTVDGEVKNFGANKKVVLLAADSSSVTKIDSAEVGADGKFKFKKSTPYANLFKLQIGESIYDFIAQNGDDISFKTNAADSAHNYEITGSGDSEKIKEVNNISNTYGAKNAKLVAEFQSKAQAGGNKDSLLKVYTPEFQQNINAYGKEVLKFIDDNKSSLAAFYAATSLDPMRYEAELVKYADDLNGQFKDNPAVQKFVKQMEVAKPLSIGHKAPDFASTSIDGKQVKLSDYKGKYVLIDFWASWCMPCRAENPNVVKAYGQYHDKGLNILGVSLDTDKAAWQKAVNDDKLTWQHVSDLKRFEGPTETLYHIEAIPTNFFIDPQGVIIAKNVTGIDLEEILNKTFNKK
ncbi:TlpA disulfide reductase family protein [Mucilaginibacter sp. KACC 22063]|uniref:TlpA disulfide reductase family protein n=1 Tax=Mucilaginibacter sp. KACC 22063 TaxID=3025666 RepID=UPI00236582A9|nr:TlpA disulfide reductase family protein [Mucilaginibacter sp. KACC 22063]WDF53741.1 TlpA disulfide reductase family protein [Mucilaginibacter sp. KACC 22063]